MKVGVLAVGQVGSEFLAATAHGLMQAFPDTTSEVIHHALPMPEHAYDRKRRQYNSTIILQNIREYAANLPYDRVLGIIDADLYVYGLNFVFGEAYVSGKVGLISLWRLKFDFYGEEPDKGALELRMIKEANHELGHTLGLQHCIRSYCVMHFSNSIFEVDKKQSLFCDQCYLNASIAISNMRQGDNRHDPADVPQAAAEGRVKRG